jgi:predicted DNA-binding transcriptional regulator YafY
LETSARLLRLLTLLQSRRDWSGEDLAVRLEVTARTVRRDVEKLRTLGYPVHASSGVAGGYRLGAGAALPPLLLDDDEAVAIAVGLRTAAGGTVAGIEESSVRALAKLEQVLPSRLRERVGALGAMTVPLGGGGSTVDPDVLTLLATACRDHLKVRMDYRSHSGTASTRTVEPHRLVHTGRKWYLIAWDPTPSEWRHFRVDRIRPWTPTGPRFTPREPPADDLAEYTSSAVAVRPYRYEGRFRMHATATAVRDVVTPSSGLVEEIDDQTCLMTTGSNSLDAMAVYMATLGFDFDIIEPPELMEYARRIGAILTRAGQSRLSKEHLPTHPRRGR